MTTTDNTTLASQLETLAAHLRATPGLPRILSIHFSGRSVPDCLVHEHGDDDAIPLLQAARRLTDPSWTSNRHHDKWHVELHGCLGDAPVCFTGFVPGDKATSAAELCAWFAAELDKTSTVTA